MKKLLICLMLIAVPVFAADENSDNDGGTAYGASGSARSTTYITWDNETYAELYPYKEFSLNMKIASTAAETLIVNFLGSNHTPDSLKYYVTLRCDTLKSTGSAATAWKSNKALKADSTIYFALPYASSELLCTVPRYLKVQFVICDSAGTVSTATISDSWIAK